MRRTVGLLGVAALLLSSTALGRDTTHHFPIDEALNSAAAEEKLNAGIRFYFKGQSHPAVSKRIVEAVSNKKTNAFGKSDQTACNWALLSALVSFQDRALREGGNAVVDLVSYYKRNTYESATEFECHAGNVMAGVALKGKVVKLAE